VIHRVRFGETLSIIAKYYYGQKGYAPLIQLENRIAGEKPLEAGQLIRIPTAWNYTVRKNMTLPHLANLLWGDNRRWHALSMANRLEPRARIRKGSKVLVPCLLTYMVTEGDTFADISRRYFGTDKYAALIAAHNFSNADRPATGTQIEIPLAHVQIDPLRLEELTNSRLLGVSSILTSETRAALQEANALLRRGDYYSVSLRLVRLLSRDQQSDGYMAEAFKLLAVSYVALGQPQLAIQAFNEALIREPSMQLDLERNSPKVIKAFNEAKKRKR
jgi:LysM repeat protein